MFRCKHDWNIWKQSNIMQLDDMGYPLRLFIVKCSKCDKFEQQWIDVSEEELEELETEKSTLLEWE